VAYARHIRGAVAEWLATNSWIAHQAGMYCLYTGPKSFFARVDVHAVDGTEAIPTEVFERLKRYQ